MSYYAQLRNGAVHLYRDGQGIPVTSFGHGAGFVSALVSGNEIYCQNRAGLTVVFKINGNSVQQTNSY